MALGKNLSNLVVKPEQVNSDLFSKLLMEAVDAIVAFDDTKNIILWNKSAERILGFKTSDALGKNIDDYLKTTTNLNDISVSGQQIEILNKIGIYVSVNLKTTKIEDGLKLIHMLTFIENIEEKNYIKEQLRFRCG
jgi:PAS domain S-box-containing protein